MASSSTASSSVTSSSNKRSRSEDDKEEEKLHRKMHNFDLNEEPKPEEEDNLNEEQEDAEVGAALALNHLSLIRDITRNVNQHIETGKTDQEIPLDSVLWFNEAEKQRWIKIKKPEPETKEEAWNKKMKLIAKSKHEKDDSDATLRLLRRWKIQAIPPANIVQSHLIERCSGPIRKQITREDERQSKLGLSKSQVMRKFLPFLKEARMQQEEGGVRVSVYGPDGKVHEMKMRVNEKKNEVDLTLGWRKFVEDYELEEDCDFISVWMFRHKESREICLAIDIKTFDLKKQVSKRISKAVFDGSD